jgi:DNA-binding beta-propeller fold protein YncE
MKNLNIRKIVVYFFFAVVLFIDFAFTQYAQAFDFKYELGFGGRGIGRGKFDYPVDIAVDSEENIYVIDQGNGRIQKFDKDGDFILKWGKRGAKEGEFKKPASIYIDSDDMIYVVDSFNHRIQKFDTEGVFISSVGILGSRVERFNMPNDIGFDRHNYLYVADTRNNRIQKFTDSWSFKKEFGRLGPKDIKFVDYKFGFMYVTSFSNCVVQRFDLNFNYDDDFTLKPMEEDLNTAEEEDLEDDDNGDTETAEEEDLEDDDNGDMETAEEEDLEDDDNGDMETAEEEDLEDDDNGDTETAEEEDLEDDDNGDTETAEEEDLENDDNGDMETAEEEDLEDDDNGDMETAEEEEIPCGIKRMVVHDHFLDKNLLVIFNGYDSVFVYDYEGNYVDVLSEGKFRFKNPTSVYTKEKYLYVVDGGNNYIHKFKRR